jgi:hypothetical protein
MEKIKLPSTEGLDFTPGQWSIIDKFLHLERISIDRSSYFHMGNRLD